MEQTYEYITTYSKIHFTPLSPCSEDICIEDIAHALSNVCRAGGHCKYFYSVAQHSIVCYEEAKARGYCPKVQLACLLHDASEAYIADIIRPVKKHLLNYLEIESKLQKAIYDKFLAEDLLPEEEVLVKNVDDSMLYYEFYALMGEKIFDQAPKIYSTNDFSKEDPACVEEKFLKLYKNI